MAEALEKAYEIMKLRIGEQTSQSEWFEITQERVNDFADVTFGPHFYIAAGVGIAK